MGVSVNSISDYYSKLNLNQQQYLTGKNAGTHDNIDGEANEKINDKTNRKSNSASEVDATGKIECKTCKERKYQDGSDDPSVSFKTPGKIDPQSAGAVVRAHEQEHVSHEAAKAQMSGRKVVSQSVSIHTGICPECGNTYVSGGTTRTVTKAENDNSNRKDFFLTNYNDLVAQNFGLVFDVRV